MYKKEQKNMKESSILAQNDVIVLKDANLTAVRRHYRGSFGSPKCLAAS